MACRLDGAKPFSEPMLEYNWLDLWEQTSNINRNLYIFIQENGCEDVVWKMAPILSRSRCINKTPPAGCTYLCRKFQKIIHCLVMFRMAILILPIPPSICWRRGPWAGSRLCLPPVLLCNPHWVRVLSHWARIIQCSIFARYDPGFIHGYLYMITNFVQIL